MPTKPRTKESGTAYFEELASRLTLKPTPDDLVAASDALLGFITQLNEPNRVIPGPNGDDWFLYRESRIRKALERPS